MSTYNDRIAASQVERLQWSESLRGWVGLTRSIGRYATTAALDQATTGTVGW